VTTAKTSVRAEVSARSRGLYDVTFVPQETLPHFINITFNEEHIKNSPFRCEVVASGDDLPLSSPFSSGAKAGHAIDTDLMARGRPGVFEVSSEQSSAADMVGRLRIVDPNGKACKYERVQTKSGARLRFVPKLVGRYALKEAATDVEIQTKDTYDASLVRVLQAEQAFAGQPASLVVDTSGAGRGALSLAMKAAGYDIKHSIRDLSDGKFEITYLPTLPIPHKLEVKFNNAAVTERAIELPVLDPMTGKAVTAAGLGLYQARVGGDASFVIDTMGRKTANFDVVITGPADAVPPFEAVPIRCYQQKDGNLLAEYQPGSVGVHKIEVLDGGRLIHGAPFHCNAFDPDGVVLRRVPQKKTHEPGVPIQFQVDRRRAGQSDLEVTVTSPLGDALPVDVRGLTGEEAVDLVEFRPDAPGQYKFVIRYGGEQIPESPLHFAVADAGSTAATAGVADPRQELRVFGQGLQRAQLHAVATFEMEYADSPGAGADGNRLPEVTVSDPRGKAVKCSVSRAGAAGMVVKYTPLRTGNHLIRLNFPSGQVSLCIERKSINFSSFNRKWSTPWQ